MRACPLRLTGVRVCVCVRAVAVCLVQTVRRNIRTAELLVFFSVVPAHVCLEPWLDYNSWARWNTRNKCWGFSL